MNAIQQKIFILLDSHFELQMFACPLNLNFKSSKKRKKTKQTKKKHAQKTTQNVATVTAAIIEVPQLPVFLQ